MHSNYHLSFALTGVITTIVIVNAQLTMAVTAVEINSIAQAITIRLISPDDKSGSGVIIHRQGTTYYVLTSKHNVSTEGQYQIQASDGLSYTVNSSQIIRYSNVDLALLQFSSEKAYQVASLGDSEADKLTSGRTIYIAGYASAGKTITHSSFQLLPGAISNRDELLEGYNLTYDNVTKDGMSGGAILDELGQLVGIHGGAETEIRDHVEQKVGLNVGISISTFLKLDSPLYDRPVQGKQPLELIAQGIELIKQQEYNQAFNSFNLAIQFDSTSIEAYVGRGIARMKRADRINMQEIEKNNNINAGQEDLYKEYELSINDFNRAIEINSNHELIPLAYVQKGIAYFVLRNHSEALASYNRAIQLNPNFAEAYQERCSLFSIYGSEDKSAYNSAIKDCQKAKDLFVAQGYPEKIKEIDDDIIRMESCRLQAPNLILNQESLEDVLGIPPNAMTTLKFQQVIIQQCLYYVPDPIHPRELIKKPGFLTYY
jgi:tetratricopeptide (TPR) repeat protein